MANRIKVGTDILYKKATDIALVLCPHPEGVVFSFMNKKTLFWFCPAILYTKKLLID